jgi:hypothetical protein
VTDAAAWYKERYPSLPFGSLVPARCFSCWPEVNVGDRVVVRKLIGQDQDAQPNDKGTLQRVDVADDGTLYVIKLDSGREVVLVRGEFRKLRENEV